MASVRNADTTPELHVRKQLFANGFRYRLHAKHLAGTPDMVLPRFRTVVFVHGCFWHGHSCPRGKRPASNVKFWNAKIDGNMRRDRRNQCRLKSEGWLPIVIWECKLRTATETLLTQLRAQNHGHGDRSAQPQLAEMPHRTRPVSGAFHSDK
jgi:DNA mismatch endonuclease (patch repair protein)